MAHPQKYLEIFFDQVCPPVLPCLFVCVCVLIFAFSCLVGATPLSSGSIDVFGVDIAADPARAHRQLGYVSQQDTLFDDLTVDEHMKLWCLLKGDTLRSGAALLDDVGLSRDGAKMASQLSGG